MYNAYETTTPAQLGTPVDPSSKVIAELRNDLISTISSSAKGTTCKCCLQHAQQYRLNVFSTANKNVLRALSHSTKGLNSRSLQDFHPSIRRRRNWLALSLLGVIEKGADHRWHLTKKGINVVNGKMALPTHIYTYNGTLIRAEGREKFGG